MYTLQFTGKSPNKLVNKISVVGNNLADIINFVVSAQQESIALTGYNCYIKVESKSGSYFNKEKLVVVEDGDNLSMSWTLTEDYTLYNQLVCQLQFQSDSSEHVVWQSEIFYLNLSATLRTNAKIERVYPTELSQIEQNINLVNEHIAEVEEEIAELDAKTPITRYSTISGSPDLSANGLLRLYRGFNGEAPETSDDVLTYVVVDRSSITYTTNCIATVNSSAITLNNIEDYMDDDYSLVIDYCVSVTNPDTDKSKVFTAYYTNLDSEIVCQALRISTPSDAGYIQFKCVDTMLSAKVKIGAYYSYNKQSDTKNYDSDVEVEINGETYTMPDEGYTEITVQLPASKLLTIKGVSGRVFLYSISTGNTDTRYKAVELASRDEIANTVQYNTSESQPERRIDICLTDEESLQYEWTLSHYYDEDNDIHYAYFDGPLNVAKLLVNEAIYVGGELLQPGTKLYKHNITIHDTDAGLEDLHFYVISTSSQQVIHDIFSSDFYNLYMNAISISKKLIEDSNAIEALFLGIEWDGRAGEAYIKYVSNTSISEFICNQQSQGAYIKDSVEAL